MIEPQIKKYAKIYLIANAPMYLALISVVLMLLLNPVNNSGIEFLYTVIILLLSVSGMFFLVSLPICTVLNIIFLIKYWKEEGFKRSRIITSFFIYIFIALIMAAVVIPSNRTVYDNVLFSRCRTNLENTGNALDNYRIKFGIYPEGLEDLVKEAYFSEIPKCTLNDSDYIYETDGNSYFKLSCPEPEAHTQHRGFKRFKFTAIFYDSEQGFVAEEKQK
ncbi:hypothetical protein KAI78_11015 [bacterium]|nr:hypothetical protein [bacterium]